MGAERWIEIATPEEFSRLLRFLEPLDGELQAEDSWVMLRPLSEEWGDSKTALEIAYSFGDWLNGDLAALVSREIARRFPVTRIGADDGGWFDDTEWTRGDIRARRGEYTSWVDWIRDYSREQSFKGSRGDPETWNKMEAALMAVFKNLDTAMEGS